MKVAIILSEDEAFLYMLPHHEGELVRVREELEKSKDVRYIPLLTEELLFHGGVVEQLRDALHCPKLDTRGSLPSCTGPGESRGSIFKGGR